MKQVRSQFRLLLAQQEQQTGRSISLRSVQRETQVPISTIMGLANNTLERVTLKDIQKVCLFLRCDVGDLFKLEDVPDESEGGNV